MDGYFVRSGKLDMMDFNPDFNPDFNLDFNPDFNSDFNSDFKRDLLLHMNLNPDDIASSKDLVYNSHLEHLISSEAEKALVLSWLHDQSEKLYSKFNTRIMIPAIILSTLAGSASIGQNALFGNGIEAPVIIGLVSLSVGLLNTIGSFFGWAKLSEGHRISGVNYSKIHRWISIELALPRNQRIPAKYFLKEIRSQVDRLNETSPSIPPSIVGLFNKKMKGIIHNVSLPEVCNEIHSVDVYPEDGELKKYSPPIRFKQGNTLINIPNFLENSQENSQENSNHSEIDTVSILDNTIQDQKQYNAP